MNIHISSATPGKSRPMMTTIPTAEAAARDAWAAQVNYYVSLGYRQVVNAHGIWQGDNGYGLITISMEGKAK